MGCGEGLNVRLGVRSGGCRLQRALWDLSEPGFFSGSDGSRGRAVSRGATWVD